MSRRLLGGALIAITCVVASAPHNHGLEEIVGGPSAPGSERAVTTHNAHSRASHWHAVIRIVKGDPCLACQWHRLAGTFPPVGAAPPVLSAALAKETPIATVRSASLGGPSSRAPPVLL